jgi:3-oxoadipate enol-lactonase
VTVDARGHGGSGGEGFITVEQFSTDATHLMRRLGLGPAAIVGLSMGGQAAMHMALMAPELVRGLVLADTSLGGRGDPDARVTALRQRLAEIGADAFADEYTRSRLRPGTPPQTAAMFAALVRRTLPEIYVRQSHSIGSQDLRTSVASIRCPTLVLVGALDVSTPPNLAEDLRAAIPGARLTVIADANHLSNLDQPDAFDDAVEGFLAGLPE